MKLLEAREQVYVLESAEALIEFADEWNALWHQDPAATPFQSPIWLTGWERHFGETGIYVLVCRSEGQLVGLLPLTLILNSGHRRLQFLGTGISDHLDALYLQGYEAHAAKAFWDYILENRHLFDDCVLHDIRPASPLSQYAPEQCVKGRDEPAPALSLADSDSLQDLIPEAQLKKLFYYRRRAAKLYLTFEPANDTNFEGLFSALLRLHTRRWSGKGSPGVLFDADVREFHSDVARQFLKAGFLRLYGLRFAGEIIASFYGFKAGHTTFYYLGGFEPRFASFSPGLLIIGHAIEDAMLEGNICFDFLRGAEPYKYQWGARDQEKGSLTIQSTDL